jgi:hypothetical protein
MTTGDDKHHDTPPGIGSAFGPGTSTTYGLWVETGARTLALGMQPGLADQPGRPAGARIDIAIALADIAARAAANAGSLDAFLAASPAGSTQADLVRQLVSSVTPKPAGLLSLRTEQVILRLDVGAALKRVATQFSHEFAEVQSAVEEARSAVDAEAARALAGTMDRLYQADKDQWRSEVAHAMREALTRRGLPESVPVDVVDVGAYGEPGYDALAIEAFEDATGRTTVSPTRLEPAGWAASQETYTARAHAQARATARDVPLPCRTSGSNYVGALAEAWVATADLRGWDDEQAPPRAAADVVKGFLASQDPYAWGMRVWTRGHEDRPVTQWTLAEIVERRDDQTDEWIVRLPDGATVTRGHTELHPADEQDRA